MPIEVKTIHSPKDEIIRISKSVPNVMYIYNNDTNSLPTDNESRIAEKFNFRIEKATEQIGRNNGLIYVIWDTTLHGFTQNKTRFENILSDLVRKKINRNKNINIKCIYQGDLDEKVGATIQKYKFS